jgi:ADP-ribose pyrophosphatase YjhB (NUDIX family)
LNKRPRTCVQCIFSNEDRILVFEVPDPVKQLTGFRAIGGGVEWGERAVDAVVREVKEELGVELLEPKLIGVLENIFEYQGESGHEVVFVYDGRIADEAFYSTVPPASEIDGAPLVMHWKSVDEFGAGKLTLWPDGLSELLATMRKERR